MGVAVAGLAGCAAGSTSVSAVSDLTSGSAAAPASTPPSDVTAVLFVAQGSFVTTPSGSWTVTSAQVAGPDGRDAHEVIPQKARVFRLWSSADGSVLAYTTESGVGDPPGQASLRVVSSRGDHSMPVVSAVDVAAFVTSDGAGVYWAEGRSVQRYDVASGATRTVCARCVAMDARATGLAVSADGSEVATSSSADPQYPGYPQISKVLVTDVTSGKVLWSQVIQSWVTPRVEAFADPTTLVETVQDLTGVAGASDRLPTNPEIHLIAHLGTGHVTDTATGVLGYGPVTRVGSQWWYARDSWNDVTSLFTNPDLTPTHESKMADRADGPTTYGYLPLTSWHAIAAPALAPSVGP